MRANEKIVLCFVPLSPHARFVLWVRRIWSHYVATRFVATLCVTRCDPAQTAARSIGSQIPNIGSQIPNFGSQIPNIGSQTLAVKYQTLEIIKILLCKQSHELFFLHISNAFLKRTNFAGQKAAAARQEIQAAAGAASRRAVQMVRAAQAARRCIESHLFGSGCGGTDRRPGRGSYCPRACTSVHIYTRILVRMHILIT